MAPKRKAKIVIKNRKGRHPQGGPREATMVLKAGARGKGRVIQICHYWPWSPKSVDAAEGIMSEAARREGYQIAR